jgi:hypothetical protein
MEAVHERIVKRINERRDEVFDIEEALDSDGLDQAIHQGLTEALQIVDEEFMRER